MGNDTLLIISERIEELDGIISQLRDNAYEADIARKSAEYKQKVQENLSVFNAKMAGKINDLTAKSKGVVDTAELGDNALIKGAEYLRAKSKLEKSVDERDTLKARQNDLRAEYKMGAYSTGSYAS